ncbi:MAG: phosphodiesterase [Geminicoccaceae bacterium]|nr:phosphodiesterase [Geminicoccaceae bacterium]MCB2011163.1 phosphodiesterase [Geminicoccaceae bacterium]
MLIAQISDPHIRENRAPIGPVDTALCLERAVDAINAFTPRIEVVLLSGDIGNDGTPGEYAIARSILDRLMMPLYVIPGNHDRRKPLAASFAGLSTMYADSPYLQYSADIGPIRLLALDTLVEGRSEGALCNDRLDWLALELAGAERPVMVMMHHPPIRCGIVGMDRIRLIEGEKRFANVIAGHANIECIVTGHVHRSIVSRFAGTIVQVCPGIAHQVDLDLTPDAPVAIRAEPPAFLIHNVGEDGSVVTHRQPVDDCGRAITFEAIFG